MENQNSQDTPSLEVSITNTTELSVPSSSNYGRRSWIKCILIYGAIAVILYAGVYYFLHSKQISKPYSSTVPTPTIIFQPSPTPIILTASWKTYRNEKLKFELKYPQEWIIQPSPDASNKPHPDIFESSTKDISISITPLDSSTRGISLCEASLISALPPSQNQTETRCESLKGNNPPVVIDWEIHKREANALIRDLSITLTVYPPKQIDAETKEFFRNFLSTFRFLDSSSQQIIITEKDTGKKFVIPVESYAFLRLSTKYGWTPPEINGGTIRLTHVAYLRDPGFKEWEIDRLADGESTIRSFGRQNCPPPMSLNEECHGSIAFEVTVSFDHSK